MLMQLKDDEDRFGSHGKLLGGSDGNDLMRSLKAEFLLKPFGKHDVAEHALRRGVEVEIHAGEQVNDMSLMGTMRFTISAAVSRQSPPAPQ